MPLVELMTMISGSLYLITMTVVGIRLLVLAMRTRTQAELLLGMALLLGGTLGASLEVASGQAVQPESAAAGTMMLLGKILGSAGLCLHNYFVWKIFRPRTRWAAALFWGLFAIAAISIVGFWQAGSFKTGVLDSTWFWIELVGRFASPIWLTCEALSYWSMMRKRVELGLADPLVANRFLLWGLGAGFGILMLATSITPQVFPDGHPVAPISLALLGLAGIASSIPYWLAFFPPKAYRRLFEATDASAGS